MINISYKLHWDTKKVIAISLSLQLILIGTVVLPLFGFDTIFLRQVIGFISITFIPGLLISRIIHLDDLDNISLIIIVIGLSLITLMFMGFLINIVLPVLGLARPLSFMFIFSIYTLLVIFLAILAYLRDRDFTYSNFMDINILDPPVIFLCLLPLLGVFGTYLVNFYNSNILLLFQLALISIIVAVISFDKFIQKDLYPLAIFSIGLSLLYHNSLISSYLWGWDVQLEYYYNQLVIENSFWDYTVSSNINGMLSVVILPTIYSIILDLNVAWVYKIIYPFIYAFVPVGLYNVYKAQFDERIAFFSAFYLMASFIFFVQMLTLTRQQIAEFFFIIIILLIFAKLKLELVKRRALIILFSFGLITSHYGLAYIIVFTLVFGYFILKYILNHENVLADSKFNVIYIVMIISWYLFTTSQVIFNSLINVFDQAKNYIGNDLIETESITAISEGSMYITTEIARYLYLISQMFILLGITLYLLKASAPLLTKYIKSYKFQSSLAISKTLENPPFNISPSKDYLLLSFMFLIMMASTLIAQFGIDIGRLYHIASLIISPFCIIGYFLFLIMMSPFFKIRIFSLNHKNIFIPISIFLITFYLLNVGVVSELIKDNPHSISISQNTVNQMDDLNISANFFRIYNVHEQDVYGTKWIDNNRKPDSDIYMDYYSFFPLLGYGMTGGFGLKFLTKNIISIPNGSYLYFGYINVIENLFSARYYRYDIREISLIIDKVNKIYSNGGSVIHINQ